VNVARQMLQVLICVNENGFESALKEMANSVPLAIEIGRVADVDPLNCTTQVGFRRFHQEVIMIRH